MGPVYFPDLVPPRLEALTAGAEESAVTAELDRLLGDFLDALSATGDALSRVAVVPETARRRPSISEQAE
jgi:hypothetical protein